MTPPRMLPENRRQQLIRLLRRLWQMSGDPDIHRQCIDLIEFLEGKKP